MQISHTYRLMMVKSAWLVPSVTGSVEGSGADQGPLMVSLAQANGPARGEKKYEVAVQARAPLSPGPYGS
jgi:hypothetical protein